LLGTGATFFRGYNVNSRPEFLAPDRNGNYSVEIEELDRIELKLDTVEGYSLVDGKRQQLPIGSTLRDGVFYWQLGPGFLAEHSFVFLRPEGTLVRLYVIVRPKSPSRSDMP
jgi:hypothetical protein